MATYIHMSSECVTSIGGCSYDSNHWPHGGTWAHKKTHEFAIDKQFQRLLVCIRSLATWGHMGIYRHMSLQWTTSLRGNSHVSNHWQYGVTWAHEDTWVYYGELVLEVIGVTQIICHMGTYRHMSSQWTTSFRGYWYVSNHWPHGGTFAHTDTWVYNRQPILEVIPVAQTFGHMGAHGHIWTHELKMNKYWRL